MQTQPQAPEGFAATGLPPVILEAVRRSNFTIPTPIQTQAIPAALQSKDIIGIAETGTGKTMAFALPILTHLISHRQDKALIIVPTRELALQVEESIKAVARQLQPALHSACLIGGMPIYRQIQQLRSHPAIIVATPGRLRDHLEQKTVNLSNVAMLVLDEADRMLDMGFAPQIKFIASYLPTNRQTMLFSATLAPEVMSLANVFLRDPIRIEVAKAGTSAQLIKQELCYVSHDSKSDLLKELLDEHRGTILVFSRTKHGATKLARKVHEFGHSSAEIHSNRSLSQRRLALDGFKSGKYRVLVATDVASRGIDVHNIQLVINYDLPDASEDYIHRIGRTGRAGNSGMAISFATPDQHRDVKAIERLMGRSLPLSARSGPQPSFSSYSPTRRENGGGRSRFAPSGFRKRPSGPPSGKRQAHRSW